MKKSISKLNYNELLNYASNSGLSCDEKDEIVDNLMKYEKYNEYNVYFLTIPWLNTLQREKLINSLLQNCSEKIIYNFSISLLYELYENEVSIIFDKIYEFNDENYIVMYIKQFFSILEKYFDDIIDKISKDNNYSLLFRITNEYHNYLGSKIDYVAKVISKSQSGYYMNTMLTFNISEDSKSLLLESICKMDDECSIYDSIKYLKTNLSNIDIKNILSSFDRTLKFNIIKGLLENSITILSEENITSIIKSVFKKTDKESILYVVNKLYNYLTNSQVELIIEFSEKTNSPEILFDVSEILKEKIKENKKIVSSAGKSISKMDNVYYMYKYLKEFKDDIPISLKNEMISKIINSKEMKLIILVSVFIDVKLIEKIFSSKKNLFIYAVALNSFTIKELNDIKKILKLEEEKPNIKNIPKKYKLKRKDK